MENIKFIKTSKEIIDFYEEFIEKLEKLNIIDFDNNQLMYLQKNLEIHKIGYISITNKIAYKMVNTDNQNKLNYSQDMMLFSLCCYGIDLMDNLIEKINNLIKINNEIHDILI